MSSSNTLIEDIKIKNDEKIRNNEYKELKLPYIKDKKNSRSAPNFDK